jgi:hypothetical protein
MCENDVLRRHRITTEFKILDEVASELVYSSVTEIHSQESVEEKLRLAH